MNMTQEEKQLLLKDLCAGLPYGVICHTEKGDGYLCSINQTIFGTEYGININPLKRDYFNDSETEEQVIKPYLHPMSSMIEEEKELMKGSVICFNELEGNSTLFDEVGLDWLNAHHFDYRGLIEKGLAIEAPEGMYKTE